MAEEQQKGGLILRALLGLAFLLLVLALALFVPAGSLSFWQAWLYLAVFGISTLLITLYLMRYDPALLERRVQAGPAAETQRAQQIIQSLASLFFVGVYVVAGLDYQFHWSSVQPALSVLSDGFVALGLFFVFLVFRENTFTSATIQVSSEQKVVATGPYSLVRHPMYAGAIVMLLFTPLALGSWVVLPMPVPLMVVVVARLLEEEKFLSASLPGYEAYREQVRYRLVPFVW